MTTRTRVTVEEFLALPETEPPSELIDGEVVQKVSPNYKHGLLTSYLIGEFSAYLRRTGVGSVVNEVRHIQEDEERIYLPDISIVLAEKVPLRGSEMDRPLPLAPDLAVEVLSPGDRPGHVLERIDFYMRSGTALLLIVDPDTRTVRDYRPDKSPGVHRPPEIIRLDPVLPDFAIDLAELFGLLPDEE
jgi:Uma2 family endonuclease